MIYTSYFNYPKVKNLLKTNQEKVLAIVRFGPRFPVPKYRDLSPSAELFNNYKSGNIDYAKFAELFLGELNLLNIDDIMPQIENKILCCYCGQDQPYCHRDIVKFWIFFKTGILPQEL